MAPQQIAADSGSAVNNKMEASPEIVKADFMMDTATVMPKESSIHNQSNAKLSTQRSSDMTTQRAPSGAVGETALFDSSRNMMQGAIEPSGEDADMTRQEIPAGANSDDDHGSASNSSLFTRGRQFDAQFLMDQGVTTEDMQGRRDMVQMRTMTASGPNSSPGQQHMRSHDLDRQIGLLKSCECIKESEVRDLCNLARDILLDESNIQQISSPITVSTTFIFHLTNNPFSCRFAATFTVNSMT